MIAARLCYAFFNPEGRSDRRGLLIAAGVLFVLQGLALIYLTAFERPLTGVTATGLHVGFLWLAFVAMSKRLHDIGLSAWWVGKALAATVLSTVVLAVILMLFLPKSSFDPGGIGYLVTVIGNMAPIVAMTLWAHCKRGQDIVNQYGPVPGRSGFSFPDAIRRISPLPAATPL
jgi:uncharacterized membrane protein YhaH (DUF805 family)